MIRRLMSPWCVYGGRHGELHYCNRLRWRGAGGWCFIVVVELWQSLVDWRKPGIVRRRTWQNIVDHRSQIAPLLWLCLSERLGTRLKNCHHLFLPPPITHLRFTFSISWNLSTVCVYFLEQFIRRRGKLNKILWTVSFLCSNFSFHKFYLCGLFPLIGIAQV